MQANRWSSDYEEGDKGAKIALSQWRWTNQWVALNRAHAVVVAQDDIVNERFEFVCRCAMQTFYCLRDGD